MSGIYIPGMEMRPEEAVSIIIYPGGRARVWRPGSLVGHEYDALPVPDHGDLIDRDALWEKIKGTRLNLSRKEDDYLYNAAFLAGWRAAAQIVIHMPAIISADKEEEG